ncbi:hypothetical protein [Algoriphagus aquimarinus]|uniref:DUF4149 domain-containing protein n=1 Tax=Algoriphagus aquimarinus TaxID=237018 RepID=A0A1I0XQ38_9BACT|nr:hypothetical protein [Algoriphagus aquimarinus]SFB03249.1 hypothetical protein SAMN04489723_103331 [Algoriphagus aquimarinus]|tara:strand:+ start:339114 stop:339551 length:438 start_codon:yes stop_codon:yes gene_type:complete
MSSVKNPISLISTFLWIGFVCAISFMEAWLKFTAPGITLPLGLGIGRLVFDALNKVEWVFAIAIIVSGFMVKEKWLSLKNLAFAIPLVLLIVQTLWTLPALDARAELYITDQTVPPSNLHFYYVAMEVFKVASLLLFGIKHFKSN